VSRELNFLLAATVSTLNNDLVIENPDSFPPGRPPAVLSETPNDQSDLEKCEGENQPGSHSEQPYRQKYRWKANNNNDLPNPAAGQGAVGANQDIAMLLPFSGHDARLLPSGWGLTFYRTPVVCVGQRMQ